jgi:NADPH:quinone reductase-like Zn-dependent oxidoreductase
VERSRAETAGALAAVAAKLRSGTLAPVVGEELPLREVAVAHAGSSSQGLAGS